MNVFKDSKGNLNVVLFVSRNKDNRHLDNYKQRQKSFLTKESIDSDYLKKEFRNFVNDGVPGETSRMYFSINDRDEDKIRLELIHFLIDTPEVNICGISSKLASIGELKNKSKTKQWLFDFDVDDLDKVKEFCSDILEIDNTVKVDTYHTPNGYAIVTSHGFDTRKLLEKWNDNDELKETVTLKRDAMMCVEWKTLYNFSVTKEY